MFNNIIYFIIVLLIFNISFPENTTENSLSYTLGMLLGCWLVFALYCRLGFKRLMVRFTGAKKGKDNFAGEYQGLILRLSMLSIFLFALDVYILNLKYWLQIIPGLKQFSVLQGILALMLFIFYLSTIWYFAHPAYMVAFQAKLTRFSFIISNIKLNLPIIFPWLIISLIIDLISLTPWSGPESFLNKPEGQILFFACFIIVIMIFLPPLIQYWWGCRAFEPSERVKELETFLHEKGFKYRNLLNWPIFEGRMMTAGIMGIVPRYRYILITDALMEILSLEELKAVMAHEMGHARYRHFLFYMLFLLGYIVIVIGLYPFLLYYLTAQPMLINALEGAGSQAATLFYLVLSLPILITMFVYFRYVMGFFMRNFERQADLHSAVIMDGPRYTISSLEKIALLGGKIRDLPSWHHFSIKERVDCLLRFLREPGLVKRHSRFLTISFSFYLLSVMGFGYLFNFSPIKHNIEMANYRETIGAYEKIILLDPTQPVALNNLAWYLVTTPYEELRNPQRALTLAGQATAMEKSPMFLDTLAEAYYANGLIDEAIVTINKAISLATEDVRYYEKQLKKFKERREKKKRR